MSRAKNLPILVMGMDVGQVGHDVSMLLASKRGGEIIYQQVLPPEAEMTPKLDLGDFLSDGDKLTDTENWLADREKRKTKSNFTAKKKKRK